MEELELIHTYFLTNRGVYSFLVIFIAKLKGRIYEVCYMYTEESSWGCDCAS